MDVVEVVVAGVGTEYTKNEETAVRRWSMIFELKKTPTLALY